MAKPIAEIKIKDTDIDAVAVAIKVAGDRLSGTVLQNKQVFDAYPAMVGEHLNDLCDYVSEQAPEGDSGVSYTQTELAVICAVLDCTESQITL